MSEGHHITGEMAGPHQLLSWAALHAQSWALASTQGELLRGANQV